MNYLNKTIANHHFELAGIIGITVSHQVFVKPKIERLRTSSHLKEAKRSLQADRN